MGEGPKDLRNDAGVDPRTRGDELTSRSTSDLTGRPVENFDRPAGDSTLGYAADVSSSASREDATGETAEIRSDIEQARANISDTVDAIQQRLSPSNIVAGARETVKQKTRERARQVGDAASQMADRTREVAGQVADRTREVAGQVADRTREVAGQVAGRTREASTRAASTARENPWVTAAAVAGVGAAAWFLMRRRNAPDYDQEFDDEFTEESLYYDEFEVDDDAEGRGFMGTASVPLVIAGVGVGYWLWNRQGRRASSGSGYPTDAYDTWSETGGYGADAGSYRTFDETSGTWREEAGEAGDRVRDAVSNAADRARGAVSQATDRARGAMQSAKSRARGAVGNVSQKSRQLANQATEQVSQAGRRAQSQLEYWMDTNPLAVGAAALVIGAAVGLALPTTEREREMIGPARDRLMDRAQQMAGNAVDRAKQTAKQTVHEVAEKAAEAMHQAGGNPPSGSGSQG